MSIKIPDINRPEWGDIILGNIECEYANYVLQTNIHQLKREVKQNKKTLDLAVGELFELCSKYAVPVQSDLKKIFISW